MVCNILTGALALSLITSAAHAQCRTWVFLTEKAEHAAALTDLRTAFDPHAINRRLARRTDPGLFDTRDLPIAEDRLAAIRATGATIHAESRWLNAVSVDATDDQLAVITQLSFVTHTQPVRTAPATTTVGPQQPITSAFAPRDFYGWASSQTQQVNLQALHSMGFTGQGVRIAVLDSGFRREHTAFRIPGHPLSIVGERDFVQGDADTGPHPRDFPGQSDHGTQTLGVLAAYWPGLMVGGAYNASYILCKTEDLASETPAEEDNYVAALEYAESRGADVITSSLFYSDWYSQADLDGSTPISSAAVNIAIANGVHCCTAAGNSGHDADPLTSHLGAPADAFLVITCGAAEADGSAAWFSSDGPTADGRLKPELLARGVQTTTIQYDDPNNFAYVSGTSMATPIIASVVACLAQAHPQWTPAQMRAALFASASDHNPDPLCVRGYGIPNAAAVSLPCGTSDFNGDGHFGTDQDVEAFFACLAGNCCKTCWPGGADFNGDGDVGTAQDIEAFFRVLGGGHC